MIFSLMLFATVFLFLVCNTNTGITPRAFHPFSAITSLSRPLKSTGINAGFDSQICTLLVVLLAFYLHCFHFVYAVYLNDVLILQLQIDFLIAINLNFLFASLNV